MCNDEDDSRSGGRTRVRLYWQFVQPRGLASLEALPSMLMSHVDGWAESDRHTASTVRLVEWMWMGD